MLYKFEPVSAQLREIFSVSFLAFLFHGFSTHTFRPPGHHRLAGTLFPFAWATSRRRRTMNEQDFISWKKFQEKYLSRRNLIRGAAGTAAGAGLVLGAGLRFPARADELDEGQGLCGQRLPIQYTQPTPKGCTIHHSFPVTITCLPAPTDPLGAHPEGRDPSLITNFRGVVGEVDLTFGGTAMDTKTGATATYTFHTDTRFMVGDYVASDEQLHSGAFAFI